MVVFPICKVNLGLHVVSKRSDGFHNIETCFYPVPWTEMLEIIPSDKSAFSFSGLPISATGDDNLCVRAYELLKRDFRLSPVELHLHKILPAGAGLGGGSSDAAETVKLLNTIFSLGLSNPAVCSYASQLGSDSPFFVEPRPMLGTGKGEILEPLSLSLKGRSLTIVCPDIHSATAEAYQRLTPMQPEMPLRKILQKPLAEWRHLLMNDFEPSVFSQYPVLRDIKAKLYERGAQYASMSGSGSALFGLFDRPVDVSSDFPGMSVWSGTLTQ